jgi:hypothetical protein
MAINWVKINQFTGEPYKKNTKSRDWFIVAYVAGGLRIEETADGKREVVKDGKKLGQFKTLKAAKEFAETIA